MQLICHSCRGPLSALLFSTRSVASRSPDSAPPAPALSPEGAAVVIVSLQGALVTHTLPSSVAPAQAAQGLRVAGLSCPGDAAAPKIVADSCGKEEGEGGRSATRQAPRGPATCNPAGLGPPGTCWTLQAAD